MLRLTRRETALIIILIEMSVLFAGVSYIKAKDSFYQKLADGFNVNILIVGDSIGKGASATIPKRQWTRLLSEEIQKTYNVQVKLNNISMGENTSYAGYVRTKTLDDGIDYDLVVICYGQNDAEENFSLYYESIIRCVKDKYPKAAIIPVLESSQKTYTKKIREIQALAEHYGLPVADMIAPFSSDYDSFTDDKVHPNNKGHQIYCDTIMNTIKPLVENKRGDDPSDVAVVNEDVAVFDNFEFIESRQFIRNGNKFTLNTSLNCSILGIYYNFIPGNNNCRIEIDGKAFAVPEISFDYDFSQCHIMVVNKWDAGETVNIKNNISVIFGNDQAGKEQADGFSGIALSG